MGSPEKSIGFLFLNQMAGPLFRELAEDLSSGPVGNVLLTGHPDTLAADVAPGLKIISGPEYDRGGRARRLWSWLRFFIRALRVVLMEDRSRVLFIVSNPPFLGGVGLVFRFFRRQRYVLLVYDIYPDLAVALGRLRPGWVVRCWQWFNRIVYEKAELVFTLSEAMARTLESQFDVRRTKAEKVMVVPAWADIARIKPLGREKNEFAKEKGLLVGTTVLYSGNMGYSHDLETILGAAERLAGEKDIRFLFIGNGAQERLVKQRADNFPETIMWLPFQPEANLPLSLTAGDVGIISCRKGTEGLMVPSKTYYYLAAGLAPVFIGAESCVSICGEEVGVHVLNGDAEGLAEQIKKWQRDPESLAKIQRHAREIAESRFSRNNTTVFRDILWRFLEAP